MTCIIGAIENNKIYIGGDSQITGNYFKTNQVRKVFCVGSMLIGVSGSLRVLNVLQYNFKLPSHNQKFSVDQYIHTTFVNKIREIMRDSAVAEIDSNKESTFMGLLVGYRGKLYEISSDYSVESFDRFWAVGSGMEYAVSAMTALEEHISDPSQRILKSLEISGRYSASVGAPYYVEALECPIS